MVAKLQFLSNCNFLLFLSIVTVFTVLPSESADDTRRASVNINPECYVNGNVNSTVSGPCDNIAVVESLDGYLIVITAAMEGRGIMYGFVGQNEVDKKEKIEFNELSHDHSKLLKMYKKLLKL